MDRFSNSKIEKQTIYEIYRACRLCGAGGGYKMPIIQNVIDLEDSDVELRQKIRECVQIEVHQDDKMPPLICELCVDKVNDFYEFLEMCRQTNKRTRLRLGLPPQTMPQGAPDAGDCILGVTEPIYVNDDNEPLSKHKSRMQKNSKAVEKDKKNVKGKKEPVLRIKMENNIIPREIRMLKGESSRHSRTLRRPPTPPRPRRSYSKQDNLPLTRLKQQEKGTPTPKGILKRETKVEEAKSLSVIARSLKRSREEPPKPPVPAKKVKIAEKPTVQKPPPKTSPPSSNISFRCHICKQQFRNPQGLSNHNRQHTVKFTDPKVACNACGEWFATPEETAAHHRRHKARAIPYRCRHCATKFRLQSAYNEHFDKNQCAPSTEVPDVQCAECWKYFPTNNLMEEHKCPGEDGRPGGKCCKCSRSYATLKSLKKHESGCTAKKKGELEIDPVLLSRVKPIRVRVARCDPLLANVKREHYDVSAVKSIFGLDKNCVYPFISGSLCIKPEPFDGMVNIKDEIKDEFDLDGSFVHWDSDYSTDSDDEVASTLVDNPFVKQKRVDSLSTLSLKIIFSQRLLGKVPRKKRKIKHETQNAFDSMLNTTDFDSSMSRNINNIIDNLADDETDKDGDGNDQTETNMDINDVSMNNSNGDENDKPIENNESSSQEDSAEVSEKKINDENENVSAGNIEDVEMTDEIKEIEHINTNTDINIAGDVSESPQEVDQSKTSNNENKIITECNASQENKIKDNIVDISNQEEDQIHKNEDDSSLKIDKEHKDNEVIEKSQDSTTNNDSILGKHSFSAEVDISSHNQEYENSNINNENAKSDKTNDTEESAKEENKEPVDKEEKLTEGIIECNTDISETEKTDSSEKESELSKDVSDNFESKLDVSKGASFNHNITKDDKKISEINSNLEDKVNVELDKNEIEPISSQVDNIMCNDLKKNGRDGEFKESDENLKNVEGTESENNDSPIEERQEINNSDLKSLPKTGESSTERREGIDSDVNESTEKTNESCEIKETGKDIVQEHNNKHIGIVETEKIVNGDKSDLSNDKYNINNDLEEISDTEMDDKKLMEEIDAQIGETKDDKEENQSAEEKDRNAMETDEKITLEDLLPKKDQDTKSMDLDSISDDDFNFDA